MIGLMISFLYTPPTIGPVIRAETGDVIIVTFFNRATRAYSIQPHGLHYEKTYEGAKYQDGKSYTSTGIHTHIDLQSRVSKCANKEGEFTQKKFKNTALGLW